VKALVAAADSTKLEFHSHQILGMFLHPIEHSV
jgi:hypothetical protein